MVFSELDPTNTLNSPFCALYSNFSFQNFNRFGVISKVISFSSNASKYSFLKAYYYVFKHLNKKYPFNSNNIFIPNEDFDLYCYIVIILNTLFHINVLCLNVTDYFKQIYSLKEQGACQICLHGAIFNV